MTGLATFNNLQISASGMYMLIFQVGTTNKNYNFNCFSNEITILKTGTSLQSYVVGSPPNYILKFNGNYSNIVPGEVHSKVYNLMSAYNVSVAGITSYSGSVMITFYSTDISGSLLSQIVSGGINLGSDLTFSQLSLNNVVYNCTTCAAAVNLLNALNPTTVSSESQTTAATVQVKIFICLFVIK